MKKMIFLWMSMMLIMLVSCNNTKQDPPKSESYTHRGEVKTWIDYLGYCYLYDFDHDQVVDAIVIDDKNRIMVPVYYAKGYEGRLNIVEGYSHIISKALRNQASKAKQELELLNFAMASQKYNDKLRK